MTIEIEFDDGTTIHPPNKETAEKCLATMHYTLNDVEWREIEERPDSDGPKFMGPKATVSDGVVLYQDGRELIFSSVKHLRHYVQSYIQSFEDRFGDASGEVEVLSSPDVSIDSLVSA